MCGRYALSIDQDAFEDAFGVLPPADFEPRYNIAPTQSAPVLRSAGSDREAISLGWGFRHAEPGKRMPLINARAETAAEKRSFAESFRQRRCLVPADGYYEWRGAGSRRQPVLFRPAAGAVLAFAGLWQDDVAGHFTILTTEAADVVAPIHDRMPVVLPADLYAPWLDPSVDDADLVTDLLRQASPPQLAATPVSTVVNNVANEGPECWAEPEDEPQARLF